MFHVMRNMTFRMLGRAIFTVVFMTLTGLPSDIAVTAPPQLDGRADALFKGLEIDVPGRSQVFDGKSQGLE